MRYCLAFLFLFLFSQSSFAAGAACGGLAGKTCGANDWCSYSARNACGVADAEGVCKPRPEKCLAVYMPVCGCNGLTYQNACTAHSKGVSIAYVGVCRKLEPTTLDSTACVQVITCGMKDGKSKEYPNPCEAAADGATSIAPKTGSNCPVLQ